MNTAPTISVRNLQRRVRVDTRELERFAACALGRVLALESSPRSALRRLRRVSVVLVGTRRMSSLHREFLGEHGPTDVLTFRHGEILIAPEVAREQARRFGNSLGREIRLYIVHGLLHLDGLNDTTPAAARRMRAMQEKILTAALQSVSSMAV